jgi:hypothetical protein
MEEHRNPLVWLVADKPTRTFVAIGIVTAVPMLVQFNPFDEQDAEKEFPLRVNCTQ